MKYRALLTMNCMAALMLGGTGLYAVVKPTAVALKGTSAVAEGPRIKVLLEKNIYSALLEAKGEYAVINKATGELLSTGQTGKRFVTHALQEGLRWGEEYPDVFQFSVVPRSPTTMMYVNGMQYKGAISVYHCKDKKVAIVNEVSLEDYLKSTLTVDIERKFSKEALAAIVIAARTEAFAKIKTNTSNKPWDITSQEGNYFGFAVTCQKKSVEEAIDWTRFMVLESGSEGGPIQNLNLSAEKAQELADRGFDAKKILQNACPSAKLSVTELPKQQRVVR